MYALKGKREYQEDCGVIIELGEVLLLAVADGFNKPGESGIAVSKSVTAEAMVCAGTHAAELQHNPEKFLLETFARIHERTKHHIAGSTLSFAIVNRVVNTVTAAYVGDSIIAVTDSEDKLYIHPTTLDHRHIGLTSAFGDSYNAAFRSNKPTILRHTLGPESILIVSSDGLYPVEPPNNTQQIEFLARHYIEMIREGGTPQDLANYASISEQSPDNITVAVYKAEPTIAEM